MRLFVGIPLPESVQQCLANIQDELKPMMKRGRLVASNLFHITLLFIGEVDNDHIPILKSTLRNELKSYESFQLTLSEIGTFDRGVESILWIGIDQPPRILSQLSKKIRTIITDLQLAPSDQPFKPHITLGRQVVFINKGDEKAVHVPSIAFNVDQIHLYLSHQVDGKLTYTPLDTYHLM